jgi:hypothetical protein
MQLLKCEHVKAFPGNNFEICKATFVLIPFPLKENGQMYIYVITINKLTQNGKIWMLMKIR